MPPRLPPGLVDAGPCADFASFVLGEPGDAIRLHVHRADRFKTITIRIYFHTELAARSAAATALLPQVLRRGCHAYPSMQALSRRLDDLYGAQIEADVLKIGEQQLLMLGLDVVAERFLGGTTGLLEGGIDLLCQVLLDPMVEEGAFPADLVEQEAEHLAHAVEGLADDRLHYAIERCFQSMCASEPFAVYEYGTAATLREISPESLRARYERILTTAPVDVFAVGAVDPLALANLLAARLRFPSRQVTAVEPATIVPAPDQARRLVESVEGAAGEQGELVLGFRSGIPMSHPLAPALILLDDMMGGGPSSRLFRILREEMQLMYSISSFLVKSKGLWMVVASVAAGDRRQVESTVTTELARIAHSEIEPEELEAARRQVLSQVRTVDDGPGKKISFLLGRIINGRVATPDQVEEEFAQVTMAEVAAAASTLRLDTAYYLSPGEEWSLSHRVGEA